MVITANSNTYGASSGPFHPVPSLTFKWFHLAERGLEEVPGVSFSLAHVIDQDSFSEPLTPPLTSQYDDRMASSVIASLNQANNQSSHTFGPKNEIILSWIPFYMLPSNHEMYTIENQREI